MGQRIQRGLVAGRSEEVVAANKAETMIEIRFPAPVTCRVHMRSTLLPWTSTIVHGSGQGGVERVTTWAVQDATVDLAGDAITVAIVAPVGSEIAATCAPSYWPMFEPEPAPDPL